MGLSTVLSWALPPRRWCRQQFNCDRRTHTSISSWWEPNIVYTLCKCAVLMNDPRSRPATNKTRRQSCRPDLALEYFPRLPSSLSCYPWRLEFGSRVDRRGASTTRSECFLAKESPFSCLSRLSGRGDISVPSSEGLQHLYFIFLM